MELRCVILAAGQGTRMKSDLPKVLHRLAGQPMLQHVVDSARSLGVENPICVVGYGADAVRAAIKGPVEFVLQAEQRGTGHAVQQALPLLAGYTGDVLILYGDTPLLTAETLSRLVEGHRREDNAATILTAVPPNPAGYGRIVRDAATGQVLRIVEDKDATEVERAVREINTGIYCFAAPALLPALARLSPANAQGEFYLTDTVGIIRDAGGRIGALAAPDADEVQGINSRDQLAQAEKVLRHAKNAQLMASGVTMIDPDTVYIDAEVRVGRDTVIMPGTFLLGATTVGSACVIGPNARVDDSDLGDRVTVQYSVLNQAKVGNDVQVGPFAYLRPEADIADGAKIGDFVEIKKASVGLGSKVPHHSYIGDAQIGAGVNIGAGTITCNYDGEHKHTTIIGDGAFIGANSNLVAPVKVGSGAYVASGSVITKEVPPGALGIGRGRQTNIEGWVERQRVKGESDSREE